MTEFRGMLQSLLAERFRLRVRVELRDFRLIAVKDGPKIQKSAAEQEPSLKMADGKVFRIQAVHARIAQLVEELSDQRHGAG